MSSLMGSVLPQPKNGDSHSDFGGQLPPMLGYVLSDDFEGHALYVTPVITRYFLSLKSDDDAPYPGFRGCFPSANSVIKPNLPIFFINVFIEICAYHLLSASELELRNVVCNYSTACHYGDKCR